MTRDEEVQRARKVLDLMFLLAPLFLTVVSGTLMVVTTSVPLLLLGGLGCAFGGSTFVYALILLDESEPE